MTEKKLQKTTSFDEKMAKQLVPRSASLSGSGGAAVDSSFAARAKRKSGGHMPPAKPLPAPSPLSSSPSAAELPSQRPQGKSPSPRKRDNVRSAHYGISPLILDKPRNEEESKLGSEADGSALPSSWVVGQPNSSEETEAKTRDRQSGPPPKPGGVGAMPHKPKRAADMAFERPSKPPPPPPGAFAGRLLPPLSLHWFAFTIVHT